MSAYIDSHNHLHHQGSDGPTLTCPHCQAVAHLSPVSLPSFTAALQHKPSHLGIVFRCNACNAPVFIKYPVRSYSPQRIELGLQFQELEHPREKFIASHIPAACEHTFKEALLCYTHGAYEAFAVMCRRTVQHILKDSQDTSRLRVFDLLAEARELAELDHEQFMTIKSLLLESDSSALPPLTPALAGVLLEIMKDLLYQCYTRKGKLQQAVQVRRFFAAERHQVRSAPLKAVT